MHAGHCWSVHAHADVQPGTCVALRAEKATSPPCGEATKMQTSLHRRRKEAASKHAASVQSGSAIRWKISRIKLKLDRLEDKEGLESMREAWEG